MILSVPIFDTTIQLPISELIRHGDQNVHLAKVLESALTLLNKIKEKPTNWNTTTLGLCWISQVNNQIEWATKPGEECDTFLIDPKLIEKVKNYTHKMIQFIFIPFFFRRMSYKSDFMKINYQYLKHRNGLKGTSWTLPKPVHSVDQTHFCMQ